MSDKRFNDVVIESQSMIGPVGEYHTAVCKSCSKQHKVSIDDFEMDSLYHIVEVDNGLVTEPANALDGQEEYKHVLEYVSKMRAWNCCHEHEKPLNGFPEEPEASMVKFEQ